jgi:hypothetical protein
MRDMIIRISWNSIKYENYENENVQIKSSINNHIN